MAYTDSKFTVVFLYCFVAVINIQQVQVCVLLYLILFMIWLKLVYHHCHIVKIIIVLVHSNNMCNTYYLRMIVHAF